MYKILIAEDETRIAAFIEKGLRKNGFDTAIANDGEQVLQMLEKADFDLLLLDINLPIKDGWTVLFELRVNHNYIPIIIVSACHDLESKIDKLQNEIIAYIRKPLRFADLLNTIRSFLHKK